MKDYGITIYGKHALMEAVINMPQAIDRVYLTSRDDQKLNDLLKKTGIKPTIVGVDSLPKNVDPTANHQGVVALVNLGKLVLDYGEFIAKFEVSNNKCLVILSELQDPQNVGAIIRSAAAFGIAGVLIPEHNQVPVTDTVVKVSAGMAFRVPLVAIGNINNTIRDLKERGFWIYGLSEDSTQPLAQEKFKAPTVFVLGNEARGMRQKTTELCDILLKIPMNPGCESLNVAASAAVALYSWSVHHQEALR